MTMTSDRTRPLTDLAALEGAIADSTLRPVLIFKHSPTCGISAQAYDEIATLSKIPADILVVDVWAARHVSTAIAERLRTRHESPQVLLVVGGRVVWSASHFRVTADAIRSALRDLTVVA